MKIAEKSSIISKEERLKFLLEAVGKNINRLRGRTSEEDFARIAKIARSTLRRIEGGNSISLETLLKIAEALNVDPADLFITDEQRKEITRLHIILFEKLRETLNITSKKEG